MRQDHAKRKMQARTNTTSEMKGIDLPIPIAVPTMA